MPAFPRYGSEEDSDTEREGYHRWDHARDAYGFLPGERSDSEEPYGNPNGHGHHEDDDEDVEGEVNESEDDEVVFTGEAHNTPPAPPSPPRPTIAQHLADFDVRLGEYRARMARIFQGRQISPLPERARPQTPPVYPRSAGFGAVIRTGDRSLMAASRAAQSTANAQRLREVYAAGPRAWGVYDSDPLGSSSNPLPGVVFVPEVPRTSGFTVNFDEADEFSGPIEIDDQGGIVPAQPNILICAHCPIPLLLSAAYRSPDDTVWVLRCGHMVDQKCLSDLGYPKGVDPATAMADAEALMSGPGKKKRKRTPARKRRTHIWHCPVASCGRPHTSIEGAAPLYTWTQHEMEGALQLYA